MKALTLAAVLLGISGGWLSRSRDRVVSRYGQLVIVFALVFALIATTGCASSGGTRLAQASVVGAGVLDLHSTRVAMSHGAVEANPLLGQSAFQQAAVKLATTAGIFWLSRVVEQRSPVVARLVLGAVAGAWMFAASHNYRLGAR